MLSSDADEKDEYSRLALGASSAEQQGSSHGLNRVSMNIDVDYSEGDGDDEDCAVKEGAGDHDGSGEVAGSGVDDDRVVVKSISQNCLCECRSSTESMMAVIEVLMTVRLMVMKWAKRRRSTNNTPTRIFSERVGACE